MKPNRTESENQGGKWLLTFNDMVTLLLTFFVLILSLSTLDAPKVNEAASSIRGVFNLSERGTREKVEVFTPFVSPLGSGIPGKDASIVLERKKRDLAERINREIQRIAAGTSVAVTEDRTVWDRTMEARVVDEGVSVSLGENLLFETGKAGIEGEHHPALDSLCSMLREEDFPIRVEGNTDEVPINTEVFPSNWELSVARAVSVVKYFISEGAIAPERLSAAGYADSRPRVPPDSDRNRELNRRVEILVMLDKNEGGSGNG